jgi:oligopeptide transport system permease protein
VGRYLVRRLLQTVPVLLGASFLIFALVYALPGDPIAALGGDRPLPPSVQAELRERYSLDEPLLVQYGTYLGNLVRGDLGETFAGRRPVTDILRERLPVTLRLTATALVLEAVLGLLAGVLAGLRRGSFLDSLVLVSTTVVVSIPVFVLGFLAQIVFGLGRPFEFLGVFPVAGVRDGWVSYLLPGLVLAALSLAYVARLTRTALAESLRQDYIRTARAKGLAPRVVVGKHALRNSLIPVVTFLGVDIGTLMGGAIVTETVFNLPGIGRAVFEAIEAQEGAVVVGIVTFLIFVFITANLLVDLLYAVLDPRIRYD